MEKNLNLMPKAKFGNCLYEWDMLDRFLSNAKYFEIPHNILTTAKFYCIAMFCLKLILKIVQKVDTSYGFIEKFVLNSEDYDYGKKFMEVGLSSAEESYNDQPLDSLENALIRYADDKHMTALLHNLKKYLNENKDNFTKETNPIIRDLISKGTYHLVKKLLLHILKNCG